MANQEQLGILKQGFLIWNKWRDENPDVEINLRGAFLSSANLIRANLQNADFRKANLTNADLSNADLKDVNFRTYPKNS